MILKLFKKSEKASTRVIDRLRGGLNKTRESFFNNITSLLCRKAIDRHLLEEIEIQLLTADVGVRVTSEIVGNLAKYQFNQGLEANDILNILKTDLIQLLLPVEVPLIIDPLIHPFVILVVGVNGTGKTTTIGKLAKNLRSQGKSVILAAGDTFRAAAIEQLQVWGTKNNIPVIAQQTGADSASVVFDALQSARARNIDVLIADTAGRLHTQCHLMEELKKINNVIGKIDKSAPHEVLLTLDAGIGQNSLQQAKQFRDAVGVTGIVLTKLDGTAKGGTIFAIARELGIPIRFIGVGEKLDDLEPFCAGSFVDALFENKC